MTEEKTRIQRISYMKKVTYQAKENGLTIDDINGILEHNRVSFLGIIVIVLQQSPNISMSKKVIEKGRTISYAEELLGEWVTNTTKSIHTLREALKYYVEFSERKSKNHKGEEEEE